MPYVAVQGELQGRGPQRALARDSSWSEFRTVLISIIFGVNLNAMKQEQPESNRVLDHLLRSLPIEKRDRSLFDSGVVIAHYIADYLILWTILALQIKTYSRPFHTAIPFLASRVALSVLFVTARHPLFFLLDKVIIIVQVMTMGPQPFFYQLIEVVCQLAMCGVWALGKEQRQVHFDSSIGLGPLFAKQFMIYALLVIENVYSNMGLINEKNFVIALALVALLGIDSSQFYYRHEIKNLFIRLTQIIFILFIFVQLQSILSFSYYEFILASLGLVLVVCIELLVAAPPKNPLFYVPIQALQKFEEETAAVDFVRVKTMVTEGRPEMVDSFIEKIANQTEDEQQRHKLLEQALLRSRESYVYKKDLIHGFIIKNLREISKQSEYILDLLIYLYSPDPRVYSSFNLEKWHHRREYFRILTDRSEETILQQFQFQKQKKVIKGVLSRCLELRQLFYGELMREKVKQQYVLDLGYELIETVEQFIEDKESDLKQSPEAIYLFHQFSQQCLSPYFAARIPVGEENVFKAEGDPTLLVGVRFERNKKILWVNNQLRKIGCYGYSESKKLQLSQVVGPELTDFLQRVIDREGHKKKDHFKEIDEQLPLGWFFNSMGCINVCSGRVQNCHYDWDFCLKLQMKPLYNEKAILVVEASGRIIGVSDIARFYQIHPDSLPHQLNPDILLSLAENKSYSIRRGESLLSGDSLVIVDPFNLSVLDEVKPPFMQDTVYVIEMAYSSGKEPNVSVCRRIAEPPPFEFSYNWNGRITSYKSENLFPAAEESEKRRVEVIYGENITQMRYFNEKIDYKANFDEERDCPSLPKQLEQHFEDISEEQFFDRIQRKKENPHRRLKLVFTILIILLVLSLALFTFMVLQYKTFSEKNSLRMSLLSKHNLKEQSIIKLATLTALTSLNLDYNATLLIKEQISLSNALSSDIYNLDSSTMSNPEGQTLQESLNSLNLIINAYLLNQNSASTAKALAMIAPIASSYENFNSVMIESWGVELTGFFRLSTVILIVFGVVATLLIVIMEIVEYQMFKMKEEIVQILKSIDNDDLTASSNSVINFRAIWLENEDSKENVTANLAAEESFNPTKRVVKCIYANIGHMMHFLWILLVVLTLICLQTFILRINSTANDFYKYNLSLSEHICQINGIWGILNQSPLVKDNFIFLTTLSYSTEYKKSLAFRPIVTNKYTGISTFSFSFWETEKFCDFIQESHCRTIIGQGTSEGANMVVSYLNQDYDRIFGEIAGGAAIPSISRINITATIVYFYLNQILQQNMNAIVEDYNTYILIFWRKVSLVLALGLLFCFSLGFFFLYYKRYFKKHQYHQDLLLSIPFTKLKTIAGFHRFYEKYYKDYE